VAARSSAETLKPAVRSVRPVAEPALTALKTSNFAFALFCAYTFVLIGRPQDFVLALIPLRLALLLTVLNVLAAMNAQIAAHRLFALKETKLYVFFYCVLVVGIAFAVYRPGTFDRVTQEYIVNVVFFLLFLVHVNSVDRLKRIAVILVFSIFIFTFFGLQNGHFANGRYTTGSNMYDPNDVAFMEVSLLAFALWVMIGRFGLIAKAMALASVIFGILLVLYTASRGGLLGVLTFMVLFLVLRMPRAGKRFKTIMTLALVIGAAANIDKINIDRYMTMTSIEGDYNFEEGGRIDIWKRGWRIFLEHPITGVGMTGFAKAIGDQRAEENVAARWQTAHSAYILILVETGALGSFAFLLLILRGLSTFNRLRRRPEAIRDPELAALPGLLLVGFGAQLVSAFFLSQAYSMNFTLVFALSAMLNRIAEKGATVPAATGALPAQRAYVQPRLKIAVRRGTALRSG
jgi:O-antigen ligase